ncbi:hypothetical protein PG989_014230 [Apiospora arundinis]
MEQTLLPDGAQKRGAIESEDASPAKRQLLSKSPVAEGLKLCDRCRGIQWEDLADIPPASRIGRKASDLSSVDRGALEQSHCPVCRLIAAVVPRSLDGQRCRLVALSSSFAFLGREVRAFERVANSDCTVLYPVLEAKFADKTASQRIRRDWYEGGCLALVNNSNDKQALPETGPRRISKGVDIGLVKNWLRDCESEHSYMCLPTISGINNVQGFRVIDCHSGKTVEAPAACNYVALSYVWGKPPPPPRESQEAEVEGDTGKTTVELPRVIVDAIAVTQALGQRYLWVDQLCIDQNDGPAKASQIAQMDKIYSNAHLTIVAAAGQDASHGLPGVGDRWRRPQEYVSSVAGNVDVIQVFPHTSTELHDTAWARRGWTYQEGFLSTRRLIFTDHQISFLCNEAHHAETIQRADTLCWSEMKASASDFWHMIPSTAFFSSARLRGDPATEKQWENLKQEQLVNYTRRQLTNECDSVNAILGLFRTLQPSGIHHLHGLPIRRRRGRDRGDKKWLECPLAWHHEEEGMVRRRPHFPSWSWSGWGGGIRMNESDICIPGDCAIGLMEEGEKEGDDKKVVALEDWFDRELRDPNQPSASISRLLCITALTVQVQCVRKTWTKLNERISRMSRLAGMRFRDGVHAMLPMREGVVQMAYAYMDEDVSLDGSVLGLVLRPSWSSRKNAIILLKQDIEHPQHYQRIGIVRVSGFAMTRPAAVGDSDPQTIYVDGNGLPLEEVEQDDEDLPIWLRKAAKRTITIS